MNRYICIHGHFYQPPRENPWLEEVELQDSAYPYHDWNERITAECYAPNAAARILDADGKIQDIVNNYSKISFNFGPTLLSWMERHTPAVYQAIIQADLDSRENFSGHGSALAQVYNHMIMPLANSRDKRTQVTWGLRDFERRFGRRPEGMWLAETAVDYETLDIMAEHEIRFAILAPRQAGRVRRRGGRRWKDVTNGRIDPKQPYLCRLPSGRTISLFFYDGAISQDVAFGGLLTNGEKFARRLTGAFTDAPEPQLIHIATDGETYGHHCRHGDMALAYCLHRIESDGLAKLTVYGEHLDRFPPGHEVEILENTSWSCSHGVERWREDCGCNSGRAGWHQQWRSPLRNSLNWLRGNLAEVYEREAGRLLHAPWRARDEYLEVILDRGEENVEQFLSAHAAVDLSQEGRVKALRLLEMQRHAMLMFTSCGWFFDEISGLEATQILQYAARAIQLCEKASGISFEQEFAERLRHAPSNIPEHAHGAETYNKFVKPAMVDLLRVGAHYALSSLFKEYEEKDRVYAYTVRRQTYGRAEAGRQKLATGRALFRSSITGDEREITFAVLHLGDQNLIGGVRYYVNDGAFAQMRAEIEEAFGRGNLPDIIRLMDKHFGTHNYSLWHLFRDEQRRVFNHMLKSTLQEVEGSFRSIYDHHYPIMQAMRELRIPLPKALATPAEYTLSANLRDILSGEKIDLNQLRSAAEEIKKWGVEGEKSTFSFVANKKIESLAEALLRRPRDTELVQTLAELVRTLQAPSFELDLVKAQNIHFLVARENINDMWKRADAGDQAARDWIERFDELGTLLQTRSA